MKNQKVEINIQDLDLYLEPAYFIDSEHPMIINFAEEMTDGIISPVEQAIKLYYAVRDGIRYNPYQIDLSHHQLKASTVLGRESKEAYCVEKSCLLAALARARGIPSRLGFANVRNHIGTEKLMEYLETDILVFHGYTELYLNGKWLKCTPVFNRGLCEHLGVDPLDFNGLEDSVFQEFDKKGGRFMDYISDYGTFHDVPHDLFVLELKKHYAHLFDKINLDGRNIISQLENK